MSNHLKNLPWKKAVLHTMNHLFCGTVYVALEECFLPGSNMACRTIEDE